MSVYTCATEDPFNAFPANFIDGFVLFPVLAVVLPVSVSVSAAPVPPFAVWPPDTPVDKFDVTEPVVVIGLGERVIPVPADMEVTVPPDPVAVSVVPENARPEPRVISAGAAFTVVGLPIMVDDVSVWILA